jgi:hypothetical protein
MFGKTNPSDHQAYLLNRKLGGFSWYPLANVYITMENSPFSLGKSTINGLCSIAFNSYVKLPEGKFQDHNQPTVIHDIPILFHG